MRVVSLLPSATEIVFALGHGSDLVGRSVDCDFPLEARTLPVVMRPRSWDSDAPSRSIDERVRTARASGESLYELDIECLRTLQPELLLTQDLCGVCSVTGPEVEEACRTAGVRPQIVSLSPKTLEEVWQSVEGVGQALRDADAGSQLASALRARAKPVEPRRRPRVAVVEWLDPPILAGLWTPAIVEAAGGRSVGPSIGGTGVRTTWPAINDSGVDLLILSPCSFSADRTRRELEDPALASVVSSADPPLGTFVADEAYFSRPGPRLADGVDLVRSLLSRSTARFPMEVYRYSTAAAEVAP